MIAELFEHSEQFVQITFSFAYDCSSVMARYAELDV